MLYKSCSIDEVIGRVIRNTRVQDTAFIIDMHEWIPEAMDAMNTEMQYSPDFVDVEIKFHKGKLPCGLVSIDAVEYNGMRLAYGNSVKNIQTGHTPPEPAGISAFISLPAKTKLPDGNYTYTTDFVSVMNLPVCTNAYYQIEMDRILTSFENGCARIHFQKTPTDKSGLPMIPDNQNYKEAIYWYVRGKMIEAGFNDKFKWETCNAKFEFHAGRAVTEIDYPSPDQMEMRINSLVRFIPPSGYFENFFGVTRSEGNYTL